jgi:hypothetical protein
VVNRLNLSESESFSPQLKKKARGPYHKTKRDLLKKALAHLIIDECLTNRQIAERCGTSVKNVDRWVGEYYRERNVELANITSPESVATIMNRTRDRLEKHKQRLLERAESEQYKDAPLNQVSEIYYLITELECVDIKLVESAAEAISRHQALPEIAHMMSKKSEEEAMEYTPHDPFLYAKDKEEEEEEV